MAKYQYFVFVVQVGRAYQPAVIFISECEKMFKKKLPKTEIVSVLFYLEAIFSCKRSEDRIY